MKRIIKKRVGWFFMKIKKYPGIPTTTDGAQAVVWVETHVTQGACAYPITPSTEMGEGYQVAFAQGVKNLWGEPLAFLELESEHSSASSCEGFALAGGRVANFTSGQGLVLMKEVLFTISGKRLLFVLNIGARALTSKALNIHAGHDDVMAVSDCGWGMLFAKNAQEACDLALITRRVAEDSSTPFMNIQDGFLTTHTIENVLLPEPELMKEFLGAPCEKLLNIMDPAKAWMSGVVQNQDSYMKGKWAQRAFYEKIPSTLKKAMNEFTRLTARKYNVVETYRLEDANYALVGMGSAMETAMATVDAIRSLRKIKVGVLNVTSYRPFPAEDIVNALKHVKAITVLERVDIPLMAANPLTSEIQSAFFNFSKQKSFPHIYSGVYGLGGRDVRPEDFVAVIERMVKGKIFSPFALGIKHKLAIPRGATLDVRDENTFSMRGHSIGGFGSITTNKIIASIVSDLFGLYVQAFPKYGSEKRGLPTQYFLTISPKKVRVHCECDHADFLVLNDINALYSVHTLRGLSQGGCIFIQTSPHNFQVLWEKIPQESKDIVKQKKITVWALDTRDIPLKMQGIVILGIFLKLTPFMKRAQVSEDVLFQRVEKTLEKYFGHKGEGIIQSNMKNIRKGYSEVTQVTC